MRKNAITLTLVSLIVGAMITLGTSRFNNFGEGDMCTYLAPSGTKTTLLDQVPPVRLCAAEQLGYPLKYLHSQVLVSQGDDSAISASAKPWIEFKPAAVDWMIWSVVSAVGIGALVYLLERSGVKTGFVSKRRR